MQTRIHFSEETYLTLSMNTTCCDVTYLSVLYVSWYGVAHGQKVRVFDPAVRLGVGIIRARKLRWGPAVDRVADEL